MHIIALKDFQTIHLGLSIELEELYINSIDKPSIYVSIREQYCKNPS